MTTYVKEKQYSLFGHTYLGACLEAANKELSVELLKGLGGRCDVWGGRGQGGGVQSGWKQSFRLRYSTVTSFAFCRDWHHKGGTYNSARVSDPTRTSGGAFLQTDSRSWGHPHQRYFHHGTMIHKSPGLGICLTAGPRAEFLSGSGSAPLSLACLK